MKKTILFFSVLLFTTVTVGQFLTTGTATTDNKYRMGGIGIGCSSLPSFGTNKFLVKGNASFSGNVGVGTTSPSSKFHLLNGTLTIGNYFTSYDDANIDWGLKSSRSIIVKPDNGSIFGSIDVQYNSSLIQTAIATCNGCYSFKALLNDAVLRGNSFGNFIICNEQGGGIKFETTGDATDGTTSYFSSKTQMFIDKNGNIGIGTGDAQLNPADKLAVNGNIHTKEVRVDLIGWLDYVFEKEYKLLPLPELEKQITVNKHLPEIPSAQEIEQNGLLIGEMNKKLLQKVEELTL